MPPPEGPGSPAKPWGTPANGEGGRRGGRRLRSAGAWGSPAPWRFEVRRLRHNGPVWPSRWDRTWPPAAAPGPSVHGHGAGGALRWAGGLGNPQTLPSLALFINTVRSCMCPPFINRLYTCKDCSSVPAAPFGGGSVPTLQETLRSWSVEAPVPKISRENGPTGMGALEQGVGAGPPPQTSVRDLSLFSDMRSLPRNGGAITVIVDAGPSVRGFSPPPQRNYGQFGAVEDVSLNRGRREGTGGTWGRLGTPGRVEPRVTAPLLRQPHENTGPGSEGALGAGDILRLQVWRWTSPPFALSRGQNPLENAFSLFSAFPNPAQCLLPTMGMRPALGALPDMGLRCSGSVPRFAQTCHDPHSRYSHILLIFPPLQASVPALGTAFPIPAGERCHAWLCLLCTDFSRALGSRRSRRVFERAVDSWELGRAGALRSGAKAPCVVSPGRCP